jgi:hypothetical protein
MARGCRERKGSLRAAGHRDQRPGTSVRSPAAETAGSRTFSLEGGVAASFERIAQCVLPLGGAYRVHTQKGHDEARWSTEARRVPVMPDVR